MPHFANTSIVGANNFWPICWSHSSGRTVSGPKNRSFPAGREIGANQPAVNLRGRAPSGFARQRVKRESRSAQSVPGLGRPRNVPKARLTMELASARSDSLTARMCTVDSIFIWIFAPLVILNVWRVLARFDRANSFCAKLGLKIPIMLAPMAGACPASLSISVANAGGMGAMGALLSPPADIRDWVAQFRSNSSGPFQLNVWTRIPNSPEIQTPKRV